MAIGLWPAAALVAAGQRFVRQGLAFFGHALSGGGLVVLYVAIYAALHVYDLVGPDDGVRGHGGGDARSGSWLADRHRVQVLGALAVLGGFLTPALVGGGEDRQVVLFLYNALLLAGALVHGGAPRLGRRRACSAYVLAVAMSRRGPRATTRRPPACARCC